MLRLWQRSVFDVSTAFVRYPFLVPFMGQSWRVLCIVEFEAAGFIRILIASTLLIYMCCSWYRAAEPDTQLLFVLCLFVEWVLQMDLGRRSSRPSRGSGWHGVFMSHWHFGCQIGMTRAIILNTHSQGAIIIYPLALILVSHAARQFHQGTRV